MEKKHDLVEAQELADWIIINSKEDDIVANDVRTKLQSVSLPVEDVWMRMEVRQGCIKDALLRSQPTEDSLDDFIDRISEIEERLNREKPVSAVLSVVAEQQTNNEVYIILYLQPIALCHIVCQIILH